MMSERERIARLIRIHIYDWQYGTCMCVLATLYGENAVTEVTRMSIVEHSRHVADTIQHRRHNVEGLRA
jgi:hypothetical protein